MSVRFTYEYVYNYFLDNGYKLLSKKYINARTHLKYKCPNNHYGKIIFDSFKRGTRCNTCSRKIVANNQTLNIDYVKNVFKENGCELKEDKYHNSKTPMVYQCSCGNISSINFNNFKQGKRCQKCSVKRRSGDNHYQWIKDRDIQKKHFKLRQRCYKLLRYPFVLINQNKEISNRDLYGYNTEELIKYIKNHPNWEYIKDEEWQIDHIFPIKAFLDFDILDPVLINSLDNIQPILRSDNAKKAGNYKPEEFKDWLKTKGIVIYEEIEKD